MSSAAEPGDTEVQDRPPPSERPGRPSGAPILGLLLLIAGVILLLERLGLRVPWREVLAAALILIGIAVVATARRGVPSWLVIAGVGVAIALAVVGAGGVGFALDPADEQTAALQFDEPVQAVDMDVPAGSIEISGGADAVQGQRRLRFRGNEPRITEEVDDGILRIRVRCGGFLFGSRCQADYDLQVPRDVDVTLDSGSGSLRVADIDGVLQAETGSGRIDLERIVGPVEVDTGSGEITGTGLQAAAFVGDTGSGGLGLEFVAPPDEVEIDTGSGSVDIRLPEERYALDLETGSGDQSVTGITEDTDAPRRIEIDTGSGGIRLEGVPAGTR